MESGDRKQLIMNFGESKNVCSSIAPLIVLTAATLLLIFCSHVLIYRKDKGVVLLWNLESSAEIQIRNGSAVGRVFHNSFQISRRRGLLFEADVIVFDLGNCIKYQDDVRNLPKRSGQTWVLYAGSSMEQLRDLPANLRHHMDFVFSSTFPLR